MLDESTTGSAVDEPLTWAAPGVGQWTFDAVHWPNPISRIVADVLPAAAATGWSAALASYGIPVVNIQIAICNDHFYTRVVPVTDPVELERREATARDAQQRRTWLGDATRWYEQLRPRRVHANLVLQHADLAGFSDDELAAHLDAVVANLITGITEHFSLVEIGGQAVGHYLQACAESGIPAGDALALLAGSSPGSSEAARAITTIGAFITAKGLTPSTLEETRAAGPDVAALLDGYLAEHGGRILTGYDAEDITLAERPDVVVRTILAAGFPPLVATSDTTSDVAGRIPAERRPQFDSLLADAVTAYGVRDDNEGLTMAWPTGLLRRALLETARRLRARGALDDEHDVFVATHTELCGLLTGQPHPTPIELTQRDQRRRHAAAAPPPALLDGGPAPQQPELPAHAARAMGALTAALAAEYGATGTLTADGVSGVGIGEGIHRGRACVAANLDDALDRLELGDVLITPLTSSAFNAVLCLAGALVVEEGGPYSHAAIVARELRLPTIVGAQGAMHTIPDGALIEVNPTQGRVRILA